MDANGRATSLADKLAVERTRLANERTLLAYGRTAMMLGVAGATLLKLFGPSAAAISAGWLFLAAGVALGAFGVRRFMALSARLGGDEDDDDA